MEKQLIFTFFKQPSFGLSMEAYLVDVLGNNTLSYNYHRIVFERLADYEYDFRENEVKVLRKVAEISPKNIENHFNKKKLRSDIFLDKLSKDESQLKLLSNYFDRRLSACLELLKGQTVYWRERASDHPGMIPLEVQPIASSATYFFDKQDNGINYKLIVSHNGEKLNLNKEGTEILSHQPCWILNSGKIYHFNDGTDGAKISPFLRSEHLHIPDKLADKFLSSFMLKASRKFDVKYNGFDVSTQPEMQSAFLSIEMKFDGNYSIQLNFKYDKFVISAAHEQSTLVSFNKVATESKLLRFTRDNDFEKLMQSHLLNLGLVENYPSIYTPNPEKSYSKEELLDWLTGHKQELANKGFTQKIQVEKEQFEVAQLKIIKVKLNENADWFDVRAMVDINGVLLPFIKFRKNILSKNRHFKMPDGSFVLLPEEWFSKYTDLFEFGDEHEDLLRLHKQHQGLLNKHPLFEGDIHHQVNDKTAKAYFEDKGSEVVQPPAGLNAILRDYQTVGFSWLHQLWNNNLGACLADDMGLGKTIQVIAHIIKSKENPKENLAYQVENSTTLFPELELNKPSLIIMAPSLIYNWENELRKFAPSLHVRKHLGQRRRSDTNYFINADVILSTYGIVRNDISLLSKIDFEHIILDESQLIKNAKSASFQAVRQLKASQRIVLTGTPVENSLTDLWSQLTFLQPGLLGSQKYFKQEFVIPIEQQQQEDKLEKLKKIIQPFILRRTKEEVAPELPELTKRVHYCEMSADQKKYYEAQKSIYRNKILDSISADGIEKSQMLILRGLSHLRQIAIHPRMVDQDYIGGSTKTDQIKFTLEQLSKSNKKVLMFSPFVRHLNIYKNYFDEMNLPYSYLTGEVQQNQRASVVQNFEMQKGYSAFLIQLKTGGSGLNLTHADHVFLLDPWWNPASEEQAIARSHRMGQKQSVFAWRFITKDTIEEKILKLQKKKSKLASDVLEKTGLSGKITKEELDDLFS